MRAGQPRLGKRKELVAGTKCREDVARLTRIHFQFLAQLSDVQVDRAGVEKLFVAPHMLEKHPRVRRSPG